MIANHEAKEGGQVNGLEIKKSLNSIRSRMLVDHVPEGTVNSKVEYKLK